jgi:hypothetical protein
LFLGALVCLCVFVRVPAPGICFAGFIDFKLSRARIVPDQQNPMIFAIESVDGMWQACAQKAC